jgi:hypothetical protein
VSDVKTVSMPALVTVPDVDLVAAGTWNLMSGEATFTTADLAAAVEAAQCPSVGPPVIKLGHSDPKAWPGEPAVGRVANMALSAEGTKITGDLAGMPGWLGPVMSSAYPNRSIEGAWDFACQIGHVHPFVITALALLGTSRPGVGVLSSLDDVAELYGVAAGAFDGEPRETWRLKISGGAMPGTVLAAGVTTEDVRRAYFDNPATPYSYWIAEIQLDPAQLIVCDDATSKVYRVPVTIKGGAVTFGGAQEVEVEYVDVKAAKVAAAWASADASREGTVQAAWDAGTAQKNLGDKPTAAQIKKLYALPGATKSDSKLPHHDVAGDGTVGAANDDGCSAAIGAVNGGRGGLKGVSDADRKKAYGHLAAHLKADGKEAPEFKAAAGDTDTGDTDTDDDPAALAAALDAVLDEAAELVAGIDVSKLPPEVAQAVALITAAESAADELMEAMGLYDADEAAAGGPHGSYDGTHSHQHAAMGAQGGDQTHDHPHSHSGDAVHSHAHAGAGPTRTGGPKVEFTDEQKAALRTQLGLDGDAELDEAALMAAVAALAEKNATAAAAASRKLPSGVIAVEQEAWDNMNKRVQAGEAARAAQLRDQRDSVIQAAVRDGKLSPARRKHWERLWDADPDGTREVLAGLAKNVVPVDDIGSAGGSISDELLDEEYRSLFPPGMVAKD